MFHEYRHVMVTMKNEDKHFEKLFDKHNDLDEIYNAIIAFKKENNV